MRILHLLPHLSGGGAEQQFGYLAPAQVRLGHEVHVAYSTNGPHRPELPGVVLHQLKSRSNYDPYLLWQQFRLIRQITPDIVHTWILQMDILGGIAARMCGVAWVFREPSSRMAYPSTWKTRLRVRVGAGASAIVSNSKGGDDYWRAELPCSRRYVVPNGLPLHQIDRVVPVLPPGLPATEMPCVLYVGRLTSDSSAAKNLKTLLEAMAYVRQKHKVLGILCGEGSQRDELERLRHRLALDADVHFTGHLPVATVWSIMKKASVFVSLSAFEGCPNTVMEAMGCGCPLILSDIPAHREIADESCAFFVDASDVQETAAAIVQVLCDETAANSRAVTARQKTQRWSIAEMARNYERVYMEAASHHRLVAGKGCPPAIGKKDHS